MPENILEQNFIICSMLYWFHNEVCESMRQIGTVWAFTENIAQNIAKKWPIRQNDNFVFKCYKIGLSLKRSWLQLPKENDTV